MNKKEFISELESRIRKYPDHKEIIDYYNEVIQDKIDMNYMSEEEAVESLGSLDDICRNIEEQRAQVKDENIVEAREAIKESNASSTTTNEKQRVSGGKKFLYVIWVIATVIFCIASIITMIVAISFLIGTIAIMISSATIATVSVAMASFHFGIGLFLFGIAIIGVHYAKVLVKFIFHQRPSWTKKVRKDLAGE